MKAPGVIGLVSFNDINGHIVCRASRLYWSLVWSLGMLKFRGNPKLLPSIDQLEKDLQSYNTTVNLNMQRFNG